MHLLWSQSLEAPLRGLVLARERNGVLTWDTSHWLRLFNGRGERQAQVHVHGLLAAACADDGLSFATVTTAGEVSLLAPDLMPRWERALGQPGLALALSPLGEYLAVADGTGALHFFAADGQLVWKTVLPRPFKHLAFVPDKPLLVGCADFGLVGCLDARGTLVWRDGLVANTGSLACSGAGRRIAMACYSDGLWCYDLTGSKSQLTELAPCRLLTLSYAGDRILCTGLERTVRLFDGAGHCLETRELEGAPVAVALAPLGDLAWVGLAEGKILAFRTPLAA